VFDFEIPMIGFGAEEETNIGFLIILIIIRTCPL